MAHFSTPGVDHLSCQGVLPGWLSLSYHIALIGLAASVGVEIHVSNDLLSVRVHAPVTQCALRLSTTGRPREGNPIYTTACLAGPEFPRVASTSIPTEA
jgi:hypothetical protein